MCLGNEAREANKAAIQNYNYKLKVRERKWMNELGLMQTQRVQHAQTMDAVHVGLANQYAEIQEKYGDLIAQATQAQEDRFKKFATESTSDQLAATGRTGASIKRMRTVELGQFLAQGSRDAYNLTRARRDLSKAGAQAAAQAQQMRMQSFAQNNIIRSPDIAPPPPVLRDERAAAWRDALSITSSVIGIASGGIGIAANIKELRG